MSRELRPPGVASDAALRLPPAEGPAARFGRSLAVVVGIDEYGEGIAPLRSAVADAVAITEALERDHGFEVWRLYDGAARLPALLDLLRERLPAVLGPEDRLLFYFAGHGIALDGDAGPAGYLIPAHARRADRDGFLPMQVLHDELARLPIRHALVILDCCFAGTFRWSSLRDVEPAAAKVYQERYERYVTSPAWQVLTSASGDQLALDMLANDRGEDGGAHSPFALALLDALAGAADYTGDHLITADELALLVRERVAPAAAAAGHRQVPQLFPLERHDGGQFVFQVPNRPLELEPAPPLDEDANPYRGLHSYRAQDHAVFFGRAGATARLVEAVTAQPLTVVVGPSGCGKSSLVQAGLVPALAARGWTVLPAQRPGHQPLAALEAWARALGAEPAPGEPLASWLTAIAARADLGPDQPCLVIVDQLEELLTHRVDEAARATFLGALAAALAEAPHLHVVVTVRSDTEPQFRDTALEPWWDAGRFSVPPMSRDELRQVIEKPAIAAVLHFETSRLVERLLDDVALVPAPLPLLSFVLSELYRRCWMRWQIESRDRALRETDYDEMGSVARALTQRATALLERLAAEDEAYTTTIRNVFTRMVVRVGRDIARRRVPLDELVYGDPEENRRVADVLQRFHEARLISLGTEDAGPDGTSHAEPVHDELVRGWMKVSQWVDELDAAAGNRTLLGVLTDAVRAWQANGHARSYLWTDPRVELLATLRQHRPFVFNALEARFVARSIWMRRGRYLLLVGLPAALIAALVVVVLIVRQERETALDHAARATASAAEAERERAHVVEAQRDARRLLALSARTHQENGRQLLMNDRPFQAVPYLVEARRLRMKSEARPVESEALQMLFAAATRDLPVALFEHQGEVKSAAFNSGGTLVVTASTDATARVWDAATGKLLGAPLRHGGPVTSAAFSPNGRRVVTTSDDRIARIWNATSNTLLVELAGHRDLVRSAVFGPSGTRVVTASDDGTARVWDADTGAELFRLVHEDAVASAAFSPDGSFIVTAGRSATRIWDATTGTIVAQLLLPCPGAASSSAFSPDGTRLATGARCGLAHVWDVATGRPLAGPLRHAGAVTSVAFSPDGGHVVTASADHTARVWDAATGEPRGAPLEHGSEVSTAAFSPDGRHVVTASADHTARVWDAITGTAVTRPLRHESAVVSGAFSADGQLVVTASADRTARLWRVAPDPSTVRALQALPGPAKKSKSTLSDLLGRRRSHCWFSTDGTRALTADTGGTASIWDTATGERMAGPLRHRGEVAHAAFSADGRWVVTTSTDGTARIWDTSAGRLAATLIHEGPVSIAAFSADGRLVLTASAAPPSPDRSVPDWTADVHDRVRVWDVRTGAQLGPPLRHLGDVRSAAFSPDGTRIVTTSQDHAQVWETGTTSPVTPPLLHRDTVVHAAFSADGTRVVTASTDTTAVVWDARTGQRVAPPLKHVGEVRSARFSPDGTRVVTASETGTVQIWDATASLRLTHPVQRGRPVQGAAFTADGRSVIVIDDRGVHVWETPFDAEPLARWEAIARQLPYVLVDGVIWPRTSVAEGSAPEAAGPRAVILRGHADPVRRRQLEAQQDHRRGGRAGDRAQERARGREGRGRRGRADAPGARRGGEAARGDADRGRRAELPLGGERRVDG